MLLYFQDAREAVKKESSEKILKVNVCPKENQKPEEEVEMEVDIPENKLLEEEMDWEISDF